MKWYSLTKEEKFKKLKELKEDVEDRPLTYEEIEELWRRAGK